jgi:hypothetical protein
VTGTEPEKVERWPLPAADPDEEPVHEGAEGEPPEEEDGTETRRDTEP